MTLVQHRARSVLHKRATVFGFVWAIIVLVLSGTYLVGDGNPVSDTAKTLFSLATSRQSDFPILDAEQVLDGSIGRVLVTGGGGNIGKAIVRRLLSAGIAVTVLDVIFFNDELEAVRADLPEARDLLEVVIGDIRNETVLSDVLSPDVSGVINLAAVSRVLWCLENTADCDDVNVRGTDLVLKSMKQMLLDTGANPWFIQASSREVYGSAESYPVLEDSPKVPANVYGASKLRAEEVIERHVSERPSSSASRLNAIALRLSNVYGGEYDHRERLIPAIMTQALSHQPIQIVGGAQDLDMVHIDDVVDAFMLAVHRLQTPAKKRLGWWPGTQGREVEMFNVVAGGSVPALDLVRKIIGLTQSDSPLQMIPGDNRFPDRYVGSAEKAARVLGYRSRVSIDEGLHRLAKRYYAQTLNYLKTELNARCGGKQYANIDLTKLDKCTGTISTSINGQIAYLERDKASEEQPWIWRDTAEPEVFEFNVTKHDASTFLTLRHQRWHWIFDTVRDTSFELQLDEETGFVALKPNSSVWLSPPVKDGGAVTFSSDKQHFFRLTTLCCEHQRGPWHFYADSPIMSAINDLRTEVDHMFNASRQRTQCDRMDQALSVVTAKIAYLQSLPEPIVLEETPLPQGAPSDWKRSGMPACTSLCDHPFTCLDTGSCACPTSNCVARQRFPFFSTANLPELSYPSYKIPYPRANDDEALVKQVAGLSWLNVLRPQAARFAALEIAYPPINVTFMPPEYERERIINATIYDSLEYTKGKCWSADSVLERGVRTISSDYEPNSLVFLPNYAGTMWFPKLDVFLQNALDNHLPADFQLRNSIIPFTHDWGVCQAFVWNVYQARSKHLVPTPAAKQSIAWSVMGDLNSNCYRPHQDVVVPSRTCQQDELKLHFGDLAKVRPSRQRSILATFKGSMWGTGVDLRRRIQCARPFSAVPAEQILLQGAENLSVYWGKAPPDLDYLQTMNDTVFCPLPRGTTGWATRTIDAIYAGCIPVIFGDQTHHPFWRSLNWAKFSLSIDEKDVNRLEEILFSYSWDEIALMQANLMLIRDAFIYPSEGHMEENRELRGPMSFAMQESMLLRLTTYPV